MKDVKNLNGKLVCRIDETKGFIEIAIKDCKTLISLNPNGKIKVVNTRKVSSLPENN